MLSGLSGDENNAKAGLIRPCLVAYSTKSTQNELGDGIRFVSKIGKLVIFVTHAKLVNDINSAGKFEQVSR